MPCWRSKQMKRSCGCVECPMVNSVSCIVFRSQWRLRENGSHQLVAPAVLLVFLGQAQTKVYIVQDILAYFFRLECCSGNGIGNFQTVVDSLVLEFAPVSFLRSAVPSTCIDFNNQLLPLYEYQGIVKSGGLLWAHAVIKSARFCAISVGPKRFRVISNFVKAVPRKRTLLHPTACLDHVIFCLMVVGLSLKQRNINNVEKLRTSVTLIAVFKKGQFFCWSCADRTNPVAVIVFAHNLSRDATAACLVRICQANNSFNVRHLSPHPRRWRGTTQA